MNKTILTHKHTKAKQNATMNFIFFDVFYSVSLNKLNSVLVKSQFILDASNATDIQNLSIKKISDGLFCILKNVNALFRESNKWSVGYSRKTEKHRYLLSCFLFVFHSKLLKNEIHVFIVHSTMELILIVYLMYGLNYDIYLNINSYQIVKPKKCIGIVFLLK